MAHVYNTQEWCDQYAPYYEQEMKRFFHHYVKDNNNGWANTPKMRLRIPPYPVHIPLLPDWIQ